MTCSFRSGVPGDAQAVSALVLSLASPFFVHPDRTGAEVFLNSVSADSIQSYLAQARYRYWLAEEANTLIGFIGIRDNSHIINLFVNSSRQNAGLGTALLQFAIADIRQQGNNQQLTVNAAVTAQGFYSRHGFKATAVVQISNGVKYLPMTKILTDATQDPA